MFTKHSLPANSSGHSRRAPIAGVLLGLAGLSGSLLCVAARSPDQAVSEAVGAIDGPAITIDGPMQIEAADGVARKVLHSGADVHVKSGQARLELAEGGVISICGPAHFSVLKSGGALTVALETGVIHAHIEHDPALIIYTPQVQAKPIAIGDGPQDILVGVDAAGAMCIRAVSGAVRLEEQLTGQTMVVPQSGDVQLTNGQISSLRDGAKHCVCEVQLKNSVPEAGLLAFASESRPKIPRGNSAASAVAPEEPVYQVFMPPLAFDASAKVQPEPEMRFLMLVRHVRVRSTLIYRGRVEGDAVHPAASVIPAKAADSAAQAHPSAPSAMPKADSSMYGRVRGFFRRLWTPRH